MGALATDESSPQVIPLHYAGITSRTLQQRADKNGRTTAASRRTGLLNSNKIRTLEWTTREVLNVDLGGIARLPLIQRVIAIGYIEDILIKTLGPFKLNKANAGLIVDWDPTKEDETMARLFITGVEENARRRPLTCVFAQSHGSEGLLF